ncbi:MAG: hypothetical protein ACFFDN_31140 [Candidatus Hodarchaeota archaeon]
MWSGPLNTIPDGWALCNGSNGTPDLREKFIMGAFAESDINKTGGSAAPHNHTYSDILEHDHPDIINSHNHLIEKVLTVSGGPSLIPYGSTDQSSNGFTSSNFTDITIDYEGEENPSTEFASSLPSYYKLAFIMKIGTPGDLPPGAIIMSSSISIPSGWVLCDGTSGTPDLRERLIYGVSQGENPGNTGGSHSHNHIYTEIYNHTHGIIDYYHCHRFNADNTQEDFGDNLVTGDDNNFIGKLETGPTNNPITSTDYYGVVMPTTENSTGYPPYCELKFIMKLSNPGAPPYKSIILWPRVHDLIPEKFAICNDMNDTLDLRDRFILSGKIPGRKGGNKTHNHIMTEVPQHNHGVTDPGHKHSIKMSSLSGTGPNTFWGDTSGPPFNIIDPELIWIDILQTGVKSLTTEDAGSLPPYHTLTFIQMIYSSDADGDIIIIVEDEDDNGDDDSQDDVVMAGIIITLGVISLIAIGALILLIRNNLALKRKISPKESKLKTRVKRSKEKIGKKKK